MQAIVDSPLLAHLTIDLERFAVFVTFCGKKLDLDTYNLPFNAIRHSDRETSGLSFRPRTLAQLKPILRFFLKIRENPILTFANFSLAR